MSIAKIYPGDIRMVSKEDETQNKGGNKKVPTYREQTKSL